MDKNTFITSVAPAARKIAVVTGMSYELMLAQLAQETGWSANIIPGSNNLFNIKADTGWIRPKTGVWTPEYQKRCCSRPIPVCCSTKTYRKRKKNCSKTTFSKAKKIKANSKANEFNY